MSTWKRVHMVPRSRVGRHVPSKTSVLLWEKVSISLFQISVSTKETLISETLVGLQN